MIAAPADTTTVMPRAELAGLMARMEVDAIDLIEVEEALISAKHTYLDSVRLLRQLGEAA